MISDNLFLTIFIIIIDITIIYTILYSNLSLFDSIFSYLVLIIHFIFAFGSFTKNEILLDFSHMFLIIIVVLMIFISNNYLLILSLLFIITIIFSWHYFDECILKRDENNKLKDEKMVKGFLYYIGLNVNYPDGRDSYVSSLFYLIVIYIIFKLYKNYRK
jgi:hypothetical protein